MTACKAVNGVIAETAPVYGPAARTPAAAVVQTLPSPASPTRPVQIGWLPAIAVRMPPHRCDPAAIEAVIVAEVLLPRPVSAVPQDAAPTTVRAIALPSGAYSEVAKAPSAVCAPEAIVWMMPRSLPLPIL